MEFDQFIKFEHWRQDSYQHLAACFAMPDEKLLKNKVVMVAVLENAYPGVSEDSKLLFDDISLESLRLDYTSLFVGPFKLLAPPYGSVYLDVQRKVMGDSTIEVEKRYREAGLEIAKTFRDAPDHLAAELEFMYFLLFNETDALEKGEILTALHYLKLQGEFLKDNLGAWMPMFACLVEENAKTNFYKALARITKLFVQNDLAYIFETAIPGFG